MIEKLNYTHRIAKRFNRIKNFKLLESVSSLIAEGGTVFAAAPMASHNANFDVKCIVLRHIRPFWWWPKSFQMDFSLLFFHHGFPKRIRMLSLLQEAQQRENWLACLPGASTELTHNMPHISICDSLGTSGIWSVLPWRWVLPESFHGINMKWCYFGNNTKRGIFSRFFDDNWYPGAAT